MLKQRLIYLAVLLGALMFYFCFWDYIAFAALVLVLVLPIVSGLLLLISGFWVRAQLDSPVSAAFRGHPASLRLAVENRGFLAVPSVRAFLTMKNEFSGESVREHFLFPVDSRNVTSLELNVCSEHCGVVHVTLEKLWLYDLLGIFRISRKSGSHAEIALLPEVFSIEGEVGSVSSDGGESQSYSTRRRGDDHAQIFDMHSYREGDRFKDIHWKLSARLDELMVKEYSLPIANTVCIVWDLAGTLMDSAQVDVLSGACASLSEWLCLRGASHTVEWYSPKTGTVESVVMEPHSEQGDLLPRIYQSGLPESPCMLTDLLARPGVLPFSSVIYLTARLTSEVTQQLLQLGSLLPVHVIFAAPSRTADPIFVQELLGMGEITVTVLREDTFEEGLSGFEIA